MSTFRDGLYSPEAELAAIGACLVNPKNVKRVRAALEPTDFYVTSNRTFWEAVLELDKSGVTADEVTLAAHFEKATRNGSVFDGLGKIGGAGRIIDAMLAAGDGSNWEAYAEEVAKWARIRAIQQTAKWILESVVPSGMDADEMYSAAMDGWKTVKPRSSGLLDIADVGDMEDPPGVLTGLPSLDKITDCRGLPMGQMTVIAARKKVGKTSALCQIAARACMDNRKVLYVTVADLMARQIRKRMLRQLTGWGKRPDNPFRAEDYDRACGDIDLTWDLKLRDVACGSSPYVETMAPQIEADHDAHGFDLVVVDYAQKMKSKHAERVRQMETVSSELSYLAARCGFALVVGSQLSNSGMTRYSQEFEDDCGLMVQLSREQGALTVEVDVPYNRFGPAGSFQAKFDMNRLVYSE